MKRFLAYIAIPAAMAIAGCAHHDHDHDSMSATHESAQNAAVTDGTVAGATDVHNTVCPVSGDKVEDSKIVETYEGKSYHLCCKDCIKDFKGNPDKYASAVSADPAKYGVQK